MLTEYDKRMYTQGGYKLGFNDGVEKGREEGRAEGKAEGKEEQNLENARNLKELGVAIDIIAQATHLSEEQIKAL